MTEQQHKEHDETSVVFNSFSSVPLERVLETVTKARISFEAGGRHHETVAASTTCLVNKVPCTGTWSAIAGIRAARVPDRLAAFP